MIDLVRKIEREASKALSDHSANSINLHISLQYCRDIAREILKADGLTNHESLGEPSRSFAETLGVNSILEREIGKAWRERPRRRKPGTAA